MTYYVKVDSPREFRRDILESSKKVIGCLQANRSVLEIRKKKRFLLESLQNQVKELALLMLKLDDILPDKQLREEALQEQRQRSAQKAAADAIMAARNAAADALVASRNAAIKEKKLASVSVPEKKEIVVPVKKEIVASVSVPEKKEIVVVPYNEEDELSDALSSIEAKLAKLS
jgi:hypothetical protein